MEGTRVSILDDLESWAMDDTAPKVNSLNGMAGIGKTSIAHTFSERLDQKLLLGASFFCSRESSSSNDASRIVPAIAYMLGRTSPLIHSAICQALERNPEVVFNSTLQQFRDLIVQPVQKVIPHFVKTYKVIVIDALDECFELSTMKSFITAVVTSLQDVPLKFLITSRPQSRIRNTFREGSAPSLDIQEVSLHEIPIDVVNDDIRTFLQSSLSEIAERGVYSPPTSGWPPKKEVLLLLERSRGLFIYAAAAIRYIGVPGVNFRQRLTKIVQTRPVPVLPASPIDHIYNTIMDEAFDKLPREEGIRRQEVLASVILFQTPLSTAGIASLLDIPTDQIEDELFSFQTVFHVPSTNSGLVSIFHASFREFVVDPARCMNPYSIDASKGHHILTFKCLKFLNKSLRRNICSLSEDTIGTLPHEITNPSVISDALRYSCLHWLSHLAEMLAGPHSDHALALEPLHTFADEHLLHWFECLSALGELGFGLKSLAKANEAILVSAYFEEKFYLINFIEILKVTWSIRGVP